MAGSPASTSSGATVRTRRPRNSLNRDVIAAAAFAVTDRDGIGALTFEALGRELGAHATAIYRHFRDKDDLLLALTDQLHARAQVEGLPQTDDWASDLRATALAIHRAFLAHPQVGQLVAARTARSRHEFATVEHLVGCMRRAGLPPAEAARCYRVFADTVLAYSSMDAALAALDPRIRAADLRSWEVEYRMLPEAEYPYVTAVVDHIPRLDDPGNFELAVELMIESIRVRAKTPAQHRPGAQV